MAEQPAFNGNGIYLQNNNPVMQAGAIAEKLKSGNFGPFPNQSAPPGFVLPPDISPQMLASALRSGILPNIGGGKPPAPAPAAAPQPPMQPWNGMPPGFGVGDNGGYGTGMGAGLGTGIGGVGLGGAMGGVAGGADSGWGYW